MKSNLDDAELPAALQPSAADRIAVVLRMLGGSSQVAGGFLSELVGIVIPDLLEKRVRHFVAALASRLDHVERELLRSGPEQVALLIAGADSARRATSEQRVEQIAKVVADGMTVAAVEVANQRRLLRLLDDLQDDEVVVLAAHSSKYLNDKEWVAANAGVLSQFAQSDDDLEQFRSEQLRALRRAKLLAAGLIDDLYRGKSRTPQYHVTGLGRLLLMHIGLIGPGDL